MNDTYICIKISSFIEKIAPNHWISSDWELWDLCIHIDANTGFQFDYDVIIPDGYLVDSMSYQRFVKFGEVGSLLCDIILQVIDSLYLLIPCGSAYSGLLAQFSKPEYFIGNLIIEFFALGFLDELMLQRHQLLIHFLFTHLIKECCLKLSNYLILRKKDLKLL